MNQNQQQQTPASIAAQYTPREELANAITHGLGLLLAIAGLAILVTLTSIHADAWSITAAAIYGATLTFAYSTSTLYHSFTNPDTKRLLRKFDHAAIFTLIAGTYTPLLLGPLRGPWGWTLIGIIWALAIAGIILKFRFTGRFKLLSTLIYIGMGWLIIVATKPMLSSVPNASLWLLLAGGLCYTGGTVFYMMKKLPYHHAVWHAFVLAGSITHFFAVLIASIPAK